MLILPHVDNKTGDVTTHVSGPVYTTSSLNGRAVLVGWGYEGTLTQVVRQAIGNAFIRKAILEMGSSKRFS